MLSKSELTEMEGMETWALHLCCLLKKRHDHIVASGHRPRRISSATSSHPYRCCICRFSFLLDDLSRVVPHSGLILHLFASILHRKWKVESCSLVSIISTCPSRKPHSYKEKACTLMSNENLDFSSLRHTRQATE